MLVEQYTNQDVHQSGDAPDSGAIDGQSKLSDEKSRQSVPLWSAYNSHINSPASPEISTRFVDKAYNIPIMNAPAHEWASLVTYLDQLWKVSNLVSGPSKKVNVTLDMDLIQKGCQSGIYR